MAVIGLAISGQRFNTPMFKRDPHQLMAGLIWSILAFWLTRFIYNKVYALSFMNLRLDLSILGLFAFSNAQIHFSNLFSIFQISPLIQTWEYFLYFIKRNRLSSLENAIWCIVMIVWLCYYNLIIKVILACITLTS